MKRILLTGCLGQIGSELVPTLRKIYGTNNIILTDIKLEKTNPLIAEGPFEQLDATKGEDLNTLVKKHQVNTIFHLASLLSFTCEQNHLFCYNLNMNSLMQVLEVARQNKCQVFNPSSIAVFGKSHRNNLVPQDSVLRPISLYGVTKVSGELLCDYYFRRFGVDTRGIRLPGLISSSSLPGGGTTDYSVAIYHEAVKAGKYTCYLSENTSLDMIYMDDAVSGIIKLMEADPTKLLNRNAYNMTAMSFTPKIIAAEIRKHLPEFTIDYKIEPIRQTIAKSWPNSIEDYAARVEWGWSPAFDIEKTTRIMLEAMKKRYQK